MNNIRKKEVFGSAFVAFLMCSTSVSAQDAGLGAAPADVRPNDNAIAAASSGEIIVTAQKRSERLSEVPLAISAFDAGELRKQGITSPSDLSRLVSGFTAAPSVSSQIPVYTLRGVGFYDTGVSAVPAVSIYVDDIALPYSVMTSGATLDLERVEVVKGPQGTLFGQNATGGLINYIAAKPQDTFQAGGQIGYGRFNEVQAQAHVTGPLADGLNGRAAFSFQRSDGWQRSASRDDRFGGTNHGAGRVLLDWQAADDLLVTVNVNGWFDDSTPQAAQLVNVTPTIPPLASPALLAQPLSADNARVAEWTPGQDYYNKKNFLQGSLRILYSMPGVDLTSVTSYNYFDTKFRSDLDGSLLKVIDIRLDYEVRSFAQELRAQGESGPVQWTLGGNYMKNTVDGKSFLDFSQSSLGFVVGNSLTPERKTTETKAVFGNLRWAVADDVTIETGIRYSATRSSLKECLIDGGRGFLNATVGGIATGLNGRPITIAPGECATLGPDNLPGLVDETLKEDNVSWRGSVNWKVAPGTRLYASISKGYKDGGFPTTGATSYLQFIPAVQESLLAYEIGFKTSGLARWLQVNGAAFYYDYQNKQFRGRFVDPVLGSLERLLNIPESRVQGAELELNWRPPTGLRISANGTYLDTLVTRSFSNFDPRGVPIDLKGEAFPFTSKWQGSLDVEYRVPLNEELTASAGTHVSYQSSSNAAFGERPEFDLGARTLIDLRATLESSNGWDISVWGRNVTNRFYAASIGFFADNTVRYTGMPATYGVSVAFDF